MYNTEEFASVLLAIINNGLFDHPDFNRSIGVLIRDSTETRYAHCTADFRSIWAGQVVVPLEPQSPNQYNRLCKTRAHSLRHEHMVPTNVRMRILREMPNPTVASISESLLTFGLRATIHHEEDAVLTQAGFAHKMPDSFWIPGSDLYMNPLARYIETGLAGNLVARQGNCWFTDEQLLQ
jgi:hypothetical protein